MAYCRFSSDDFKCDVYCYEEGHERIWPSKKKAPEVPAEEDKEKTND